MISCPKNPLKTYMGQNTPTVPDEKIRCHRFSWNFAGMLYEYQATKVQKDFSLSSFIVEIQGRQFCHLMRWVFFQKLIAYTTLLKKYQCKMTLEDFCGFFSKKDANPLRLTIVLSHHMHRNWIGKSEAGCHWF